MAVLDTDNMTVSTKGTLPRVPFLALKEKILGKTYELSIRFIGPAEAQALNILHRGKEYIPNTLSFPLSKKSGEIILCSSAMRKEYKDFEMTYDNYLVFIIIHSMLHLKGYDHGSTMERKEQQLLTLFT
ncbi:MAG TPA: rRNA maturation RNase YbeY [Candidatus Paceibacterota bacterium]|jgi:probable rRNA maturation factor|nr:rRNA maturation RNase YbeY [Candidatus Paceibacterota bacterium]